MWHTHTQKQIINPQCTLNPCRGILIRCKNCMHKITLYLHAHARKDIKYIHTHTHTILLELNGDGETTVRRHESWQGHRKHHGKTQQPPPTTRHTPTTAGHHAGHKDCTETQIVAVYLFVRRNMLLAAEAVLADEHESS